MKTLCLASEIGFTSLLLLVALGCGGSGNSSTSTSSTTLSSPIVILNPGLVSFPVGTFLQRTMDTTGGTAPYKWSLASGTLPAGITLSTAGVLSGTPTAVGDATITLQTLDSSNTPDSATVQVSFSIIPAGLLATPVVDEEFNGTALNTSLWEYRTGVRNLCTQDSTAVTEANGYLEESIYTDATGINHCGAIDTAKTFTQTYGYWEAAVRYTYQPDIQCSFWIQSATNGATLSNPQASGVEMDVFEHTTQNSLPTGFDHALLWDGYVAGVGQATSINLQQANLNDGNFHVFSIAWTPTSYTFYVDGQVTWTQTGTTVPISSALEYAILDTELPSVAQAGGYGALGSSSNLHLDVDYVRIYAQ
jgi:endo-1,3-1,4-beta-glycanase ExoK